MKKLIIYTTMGVVIVVSGVFVSSRVNAQEFNPANDTFVSRIAEKLGLAEDDIVEVVEDLRADMQAQKEAQRVEAITQAMEEGKLTDRQALILDAMEDLRPSKPDDWEQWHEYTPEQREQLREARRKTRDQQLRDTLYDETGLEVSQEEMNELHEVMLEEGIGMYGRRGEKGLQMRGGMGMHRGN